MPSILGHQIGLLTLLWRDKDESTQQHSHHCVFLLMQLVFQQKGEWGRVGGGEAQGGLPVSWDKSIRGGGPTSGPSSPSEHHRTQGSWRSPLNGAR